MKNLCILGMLILMICSCQKEEKLLVEQSVVKKSMKDCRQCDDIEVSLTPVIDPNSSCCKYRLTVDYLNNCIEGRQQVLLNGELLDFIVDPQETFDFEVCPGNEIDITVVGFNEETNDWDDICFRETVECDCNCRNADYSLDLSYINSITHPFLQCCSWSIAASSPDPSCKVQLKINDDLINLNQSSYSKIHKTCKKIDVAILVDGKVCEEHVIGCTCCDGLVVKSEVIGSPNDSSLCKYRVTIDNKTNCDQYVYSKNLNQLAGPIAPGSSVSIILWADPADGFVTTYLIGSSPSEICHTLELSTVCEEKD